MKITWRHSTDWAKRRPIVLRAADMMGRGRGRLRLFDQIHPPPPPAIVPDLSRWHDQRLACTSIGHATVLLRLGDKTILTDPVFSSRVGIGAGLMTLGPRRFCAPALSIRQLPPLDLILISHAHFDHLDRPSLSRLPKDVPVIAADQTGDLVRDLGFSTVTELRWGQTWSRDNLKITAQQVRHWGARTFYDQHRGFNAYLIEGDGKRVLYGGDTAYHEGFRDIGAVDLAVLGISAYDPYIAAHATPEQAWQMADHCRADHIMPMHHSTFRLSHEPMNEPLERLYGAAGRLSDRIVAAQLGQQWMMS